MTVLSTILRALAALALLAVAAMASFVILAMVVSVAARVNPVLAFVVLVLGVAGYRVATGKKPSGF